VVFSCYPEAPQISILLYLVHIFENVGSDDEMFIIAPFAYLVQLQNLFKLKLSMWNVHK
jgi:hypothetical protein